MNPEIQQLLTELKSAVPGLAEKLEQAHQRIDAIEKRNEPYYGLGSAVTLKGSAAVIDAITKGANDLERNGRIRFDVPNLLETKATITSSGIINPDREPGVHGAGRYEYRLIDLFRTRPITTGSAYRLRSNVESISPDVQANEGDTKAESSFTFTADTIPVATLAHFVNISKQAFDDVEGMAAFLEDALIWGLLRLVENQMLYGSGISGDLDGLTTTATAFDTTILVAGEGWNRMDVIAAAHTQLRESGYSPSFTVVSPRDWFRMVTSKDSQDRYLMGDPQTASEETVWSKPVIVTNQMQTGNFLVGDASKAIIRERQQTTIDISDSHASHFTSNLRCIRAEQRLALVKLRPDGFIYGTLNTSPAV